MAYSDAAGFPNWTMLPLDILGSVAERLPVPDYLRFHAIAKAFAAVVAGKRFLPPPGAGSPWLLLPPLDGDAADAITFLDISTLRVYRICHPDFHGRRWVGSSDGWLVAIGDDGDPLMLNPITRSRITFPSLKTIPGFTDINIEIGSCPYSLNRLMLKVFPRDQSGRAAGYVAVVSVRCNFLAFARDGDDRWITLDDSWSYYQDMVYHRGNLYCLHDSSRVDIWDITGSSPKVKLFSEPLVDKLGNPSHSFDYYLFMVTCEGELFQVWLDRRENPNTAGLSSNSWDQCCTKVFKFDVDGEQWRRVQNLGDRAIFAGNNSVAVSTRHLQGFESNRVYFREQQVDESSGDFPGHLCYPLMSYFSLDHEDVGGYRKFSEMEWKETHWLMPCIKY